RAGVHRAPSADPKSSGRCGDWLTARQPFASVPFLVRGEPGSDSVEAAVATADEWCNAGPVLIWIDDAQHLDAASSSVIGRLVRAAESLPLTVIVSARPQPRRPELASVLELVATQLRLAPLTEADLVALVAQRVGARPTPRLLDQLAVAAGNPFTVGVLLDLLQHRGTLSVESGHVDIDVADSAVPESAAAAVRAFLGQLPEDTSDLLTTMAVLGTPTDPRDLATLAGRPMAGLAGSLVYANEAGVTRWREDGKLVFTHDLFRDALLAQVPEQLKAVIHRDAVRVLQARSAPAGEIAEHAWRGGDSTAVALVRSVAADLSVYAPGVAADLLAHVQPLISAQDTDEVVADRAEALVLAGRGREAEDLIRSYLPRATSVQQRLRMHDLSLTSMIYRANLPAVHAEIENLLAAPDIPGEVKLELAGMRCWILLLAGHLGAAEQVDAQLIATHGDDAPSGVIRGAAAWLHGRPRDAIRLDQTYEDSQKDAGPDTSAGPAFPPLFILYAEGPQAAERANASARAMSASVNARYVQPFHDYVLGNILLQAGRWSDATAALDAGLELAHETGSLASSVPHGARALIDAHRGDRDAARKRLAEVAHAGYSVLFGFDCAALANLFLAEVDAIAALTEAAVPSDADELTWDTVQGPAQHLAERLWQDAAERGSELWMAYIAPYVMRVATTDLQQQLAAHFRSWSTGQMPGLDPVRDHILGIRDHDHRRIAAAAELLGQAENPLAAGFAWEDAGLIAARTGSASDATKALRKAIDIYETLDAYSDVYRTRARAHRLGIRAARPTTRREPKTGWQSLTPTETTVAALVRQGMTNPQIAGQLFLSPRTVQTHVSHILQKTQLRSRIEIATAGR
ncbi:MAG: putative LuxR family transcriptional regulator, partial [Pseudonocardiales bacterium]|nr:putative LuxR family transcriptional regulator [Pseudonocardiales bacterium]